MSKTTRLHLRSLAQEARTHKRAWKRSDIRPSVFRLFPTAGKGQNLKQQERINRLLSKIPEY